MGSGSRRGGDRAGEVKVMDSLDESSDVAELEEDELDPVLTDQEEEVAGLSPVAAEADMSVTSDPRIQPTASLEEWQDLVGETFKQCPSMSDLGKYLMSQVCRAPTPLGRFFRQWCQPAQPPPGAEPAHQRRGDILPIPPWLVTEAVEGVTAANVYWVWFITVILNFNYYCAGWSKPVCVPMEDKLTSNQAEALRQLGELVDNNILSVDPLGSLGQARELLASKKFDYSGAPIEYMEELKADRVAPAWPRPGEAAVQPIARYLGEATRQALKIAPPPG